VQDGFGHYGFRHTPPPTVEQLHGLLHVIGQRPAWFLERRGILERDEDKSYLTLDSLEADPIKDIHAYSVTNWGSHEARINSGLPARANKADRRCGEADAFFYTGLKTYRLRHQWQLFSD